jgi:plastocyanin
MKTRSFILTAIMMVAFAATGGLAVRGSAQANSAAGTAVTIDNFSFTPPAITVSAGTTVRWTNHDDIPHTVVSDDNGGTFKSKALDTDDVFSVTFSKPGTYTYFCSLHPKMKGQVVVK